ncbi:MAG: type 1 glutamine amidotransferase [bacterium]
MSLRLLVLDAYDAAGRQALAGAGAALAGELYRRLLHGLEPEAHIDVAPFEAHGFAPPAPLDRYDGIAWTGSNLTVHRDTPAVRQQLDLARAAFAAGVPSFGSCWAVHIAVTASGGRCAANPRGREFGVARTILLNDRGAAHPLFADKPRAFDAFTSHEDHVVELGPDATLLASNEFSAVQAVDVRHGKGTFWAVQYHPEYDLHDVARLGVLRGPQLIEQGFFADQAHVAAFLADLETLQADRARRDLAYRLAVGRDVLDPELRTREARNWLDRLVKPSARK